MSTDRYFLLGNPVSHSKSPFIHTTFAEATAQSLQYATRLCPLDDFAGQVQQLWQEGCLGMNVTVPFKEQAPALCQVLSPRVALAGAANTLYLRDGKVCCDNTDGIGMMQDILVNLGWQVAAKRVLVLGAGGAVRGVLQPLLQARPREVVVANRTAARAEALADVFAQTAAEQDCQIRGCGFTDVGDQSFDLIINGTSASLQGELPPLPASVVASTTAVYDMMYGAEPTPFLHWAEQLGAERGQDGLGMLVEQAAEAFALWRGIRPQTAPVIEALRQTLLASKA